MKIDLPITITFDCQDINTADARIRSRFISHVCTLRFDSDECDGAEIFPAYPLDDNHNYTAEDGDAVAALLTFEEFKRIVARAKRYPYDYGVGTEQERTAAQEQADEQAAP